MSRGAIATARTLRCLRFSRPLSYPSRQQRHHLQSTSNASQGSYSTHKAKFKPKTRTVVILASVLGSTWYCLSSQSPSREGGLLNDQTFVPYRITARDGISPTSFVLTVSPRQHSSSQPYLCPGTATWRYPQWSVEFKQPEVQIARHFTALPPREGFSEEEEEGKDDPTVGTLRFYVRAVPGGEMSSYLARLGVGSDVWLRGPHAGFDVLQRLGRNGDVVFLAGGTGIAPGMQVARAVLEHSVDSRVVLLWAVRNRSEVLDGETQRRQQIPWWRVWAAGREPVEMGGDGGAGLDGASPVLRQLREMKARYGARLRIQISIDEEGTKFQGSHLQKALSHNTNSSKPSTSTNDTGCQLHDPAMLPQASEFDEVGTLDCSCRPDESSGPGKNLFIVSGPEGFVEHYAGPKVWQGGKLLQGPVGGVAARLQRRWPRLAQDWLVLKL